MVVVAATVVGLIAALAVGGLGGDGAHNRPLPTGETLAPSAPPVTAAVSSGSTAVLGKGPTSIDFVDPEHGWIATGCSTYCDGSNPSIIGTGDGGRTWHRVHPPDMAAVPIAGSVWYEYGGVVEIRFVTVDRGWYLQAGELWSTSDGGATWQLAHLGGLVSSMASAKQGIWALVDSCPNAAMLPCAPFHLYYRPNAGSGWRPFQKTLSPDRGSLSGSLLVTDGNNALVATPGRLLLTRAPNGNLVDVDPSCEPIGPLGAGRLVGLCGIGGGGDASAVTFAISNDQGGHWNRFVGGPPSDGWSGAATTNGDGALFYVTGGTTLWRVDTVSRTWAPVLRTPGGTTDELYPVYFAAADVGFVGESDGSGIHLFVTRDAGLTWNPVSL